MEITHKGAVIEDIMRLTPKEFDIEFSGVDADGRRFRAGLPLAVIDAASWRSPAIWSLTDAYGPEGYVPPQGHDWSGVRDSSPGAIWAMFEVARRELEGEVSVLPKYGHTPRPWSLMTLPDPRGGPGFTYSVQAVVLGRPRGGFVQIARALNSSDTPTAAPIEEQKANAELMAVSPDMLALILRFVEARNDPVRMNRVFGDAEFILAKLRRR